MTSLRCPGLPWRSAPTRAKGQQDRLQEAYGQMRKKGLDPKPTNAFVGIDASKDFMYWKVKPMM